MALFDNWNYRKSLAEFAKDLKRTQPGLTLQKISVNAGIQPPYLTNVFKERAHLNSDQIYAISSQLNLNQQERDGLILLMEWERSANQERKRALKEQLEALRKERLKTSVALKKEVVAPELTEFTRFFLNPYYRLINSFIGIPRFARDPARIAKCLNVSGAQLQTWLKELLSMGFIQRKGQSYEKLKRNFHLPKESPLCEPYQRLFSQCAFQHLQSLPEGEKYSFGLTFSADEATREKVHYEFLKFLKTIEEDVKSAPAEQVYGLSFDLFTWSYERE